MIPFEAPVEDITASLNEAATIVGIPDWDPELAADILQHFGQLAEGVIAPINATGDAQGARFENGRVRMPDGFREAYSKLAEDGWQGLTAPESYGGMAASPLIAAGVSEIFSGSNHSLQMICNLVPGAISTLLRFGSDEQKTEWIPRLASGEALSTMCLTEPGAGSDLSAVRCKAVRSGDYWALTGEKIFISGGDQDLSETILHLVLARTGEASDGVRGLSLFLCKAQPSVKVTRIEEKLGLHASPTCHMVFDEAQAELLGEESAGLKAMFTMMNHARLDVALQGVAHAARASHMATAYASERMQGHKPDGTKAVLADHADVRRMLDEQRYLEQSSRAMCHLTLALLEKGSRPEIAGLLTSVCKIYASEAGIKAADLGIQIMGGYGYLKEYGMEQVWRDARITSIYEGANGIHEKAIVTREIRQTGAIDSFAELIQKVAPSGAPAPTELTSWRDFAEKTTTSACSLDLAHEFTSVTSAIFARAVRSEALLKETILSR